MDNGYVIVTDSRIRNTSLFMLDRNKTNSSFWGEELDNAFIYTNQLAAYKKCRSFKHNNPRVVTYEQAKQIEKQNLKIVMVEECSQDTDYFSDKDSFKL